MGAVAALLARVGPGFFQQAFVVEDLEAAMEAFTETLGCEKWTTFPAIGTPYVYRGREIESSVALAFSRSGKVQIELIQPIDGEGLTQDFLREYGLLELHSRSAAVVLAGGQAVLNALALTEGDRLPPALITLHVVPPINAHQAQLINRGGAGRVWCRRHPCWWRNAPRPLTPISSPTKPKRGPTCTPST